MKTFKENRKIQVKSNIKMERRESTMQKERLWEKVINGALGYLNQTVIVLPGKEHSGADCYQEEGGQ